jgi:hypothetical protein
MDSSKPAGAISYLISAYPIHIAKLIETKSSLKGSLGRVLQEEPTYVRKVVIEPDVNLKFVTTPQLRRGYFHFAEGFALFHIDRQQESDEIMIRLVAWHRYKVDADAWIAEGER